MNTHDPSGINWKSIRLELAGTPEFPLGSASRAYMLHLPLREDGTVDEQAFGANPAMASFRRFWPNEPDRSGLIVRAGRGWALSFQPVAIGNGTSLPIRMDRLLPGDAVTIDKHGRGAWRFRVVDLPFD